VTSVARSGRDPGAVRVTAAVRVARRPLVGAAARVTRPGRLGRDPSRWGSLPRWRRNFGIASATAAAIGRLAGAALDFRQCAAAGGVGGACSGVEGLAYGLGILAGVGLSLRRQELFWMLVFLLQGCGSGVWTVLEASALDRASGGDPGTRAHAAAVLLCSGCMVAFSLMIRRACQAERRVARAEVVDRMGGFDSAWQLLHVQHAEDWQRLAARSAGILAALRARRVRARGGWPLGRLAASLGLLNWGVDRRRFAASGKVRQRSLGLEELYDEAEALSSRFQLWVARWSPVGHVLFAAVKSPDRAIQKTVRSYNREPAMLTDLVRCSVIVG
jgi:hypothetical protein